MANKSIDDIKADMVTQKDLEAGLAGLTSTSLTAIWNLIFFVCATAIKVIEDLFVVLESDVEERKKEIPVGTLKWYADESLLFQYGDSLAFQNTYIDENGDTVILIGKNLVYNPVVPANRIVALAAAKVANGLTIIKAAKLVADVATKLSAPELSAFTSYWIEKRFAGTAVSIISVDPDLLKALYTITYNAQILAADGSLLSDAAAFPAEDAINAFLQQFQGVNFAGNMQVMKLTDAIQAASGVLNAVANVVEGRPDAGVFVDILASTEQSYDSTAGYMAIDPAFPLNTNLTYING